jgi:hypothetical protein
VVTMGTTIKISPLLDKMMTDFLQFFLARRL